MQIVVAGNQPSKRTAYFIQAGEKVGVTPRFVTYRELEKKLPDYEETVIKLEPPVYEENDFRIYHLLCLEYLGLLKRIEETMVASSVSYLNSPRSISQSLDKLQTKQLLASYPVTPLLLEKFQDIEEIAACMEEKRKYSLFLKPRYGSGAGGIMAIRQNPRTGQWVAYTTLDISGERIFNTKRINHFSGYEQISILVNAVAEAEGLAEEWMAKDTLEGGNYDLRVVCLDNKVEHIVVRRSRGAITNLHLNNQASLFEELPFASVIREEIEQLSITATRTLGLTYAGIDILLSGAKRKPYIIEVNGQGDHIYQDMYAGNNIYINQLKWILQKR